MEVHIVKESITKDKIRTLAAESFGDMVKIVVDIKRGIMAIGGEMHADAESVLLQDGSAQDDLWGANLYPQLSEDEWIEYRSLINIRPRLNNRSMQIESADTRDKIKHIISQLVV